MLGSLSITADPEPLHEGSPEERACFAALAFRFGNTSLSEGYDELVKKVRGAPLLSGYHLAEWIAWNWWRLRWEPRSNAPGWEFAHRLSTIGEGYVWPNITIFSDGARIAFIARPTRERPNTAFRYLGNAAAVVVADEFEYEVDRFVEQIRGLLRNERIDESNLDRIWKDVREERGDPDAAKRRKLEALLGHDPDGAPAGVVERLLADASSFGDAAMDEIAADHPHGGDLLTAESLQAWAAQSGFEASRKDAVRLAAGTRLPRAGVEPAWYLGAAAARAVREQAKLGDGPIGNGRLAAMAGVQAAVLIEKRPGPPISFALENRSKGRMVLRSKWATGRRFDLARLLGDRLLSTGGRLLPATRAYTYRQKAQRAFAAELLSPFEAVDHMLGGDYSSENQQDVADYFEVSELTIRTLLVNHGRLEREELDLDFETAAA